MFECLPNCGKCCGPVAIKKAVYEKHKAKARPHKMTDIGDAVLALQDEAKCAFLSEENRCLIYDDRPDVCRKFGCSVEALHNTSLMCPFLKVSGAKRNRHERRMIIQLNDQKLRRFEKRIKKEVE